MAQASTREPIAEDLTNEEIQMLIKERRGAGATEVRIVVEGGQRFIVTEWPAL
jgi:hypothetical protein